MNILVIGNGFDLAHKLPTYYEDFLNFIKGVNSDSSLKENKLHDLAREYIEEIDKNEFSNYNRITDLLLPEENVWFEYFKNPIDIDKGWIDFESEISEVIQALDYMKKVQSGDRQRNVGRYHEKKEIIEAKVFNLLKRANLEEEVMEYVYNKNFIKMLLNKLNELILALEIYLTEVVGRIEIKCISPDIKALSIDKVLSFNYTDTYKRVYASDGNEIIYDFIHGKTKSDNDIKTNNMVLGIDEYLNDDAENNEVEFIEFKKYFQRIHKETGCKYKEWVKEIKKNEKSGARFEGKKIQDCIYIFGHSLDITDKDILKELILQNNVITTIFYHDKEAYGKQIANMVKVIGKDELIKRVSGPNKTIIFKKQQDMVEI